MKYLLLIRYDEAVRDAMPPQELKALVDEGMAYEQVMREEGHFVASQALQSMHAATNVRVRQGKVSVTDGPYVEANEQVGGFVLIEAKDLNEAIQVASKLPVARLGGIEIRPVRERLQTVVTQAGATQAAGAR